LNSFDRGFALVVGIAGYPHAQPLPEAVLCDAADLASLLRDPRRCAYPKDQVRHLRDSEASAEAIRENLRWLANSAGPDDTALFFFSGHGFRLLSEGGEAKSFLVPYDGRIHPPRSQLIAGDEFTALLREVRAERVVVILDTCFAGGTGAVKNVDGVKWGIDENLYERLGKGKGRALIASSRADEPSHLAPGLRNSLFTHYLLEALRGGAASEEGQIKILDVFNYVEARVPQHDPQRVQHPLLKAEVENNFAIALGAPSAQSEKQSELTPEESGEPGVGGSKFEARNSKFSYVETIRGDPTFNF